MSWILASSDPDRLVSNLALLFLASCLLVKFVRWLLSGPPDLHPDPWDAQVTAELSETTSAPLCHRCLMPNDPLSNFCSDCGAPVGMFTNWLPYPYLLSIGHTLRIGTSGSFKRSPLTIAGFFLFTLAEYSILAPVYWFSFLKMLYRRSRPASASSHSSEGASSDAPDEAA